jgi:two-component system, cell cycle sensor histidine kinase and response regulator CckA
MSPAPCILVVEDEFIVAQDLAASLTDMGYRVYACVESGKKAIQKINEQRPDLVLMDIILKGKMDGIQTAGVIHEHFKIPVIFLTAYADQSLLDRAKITQPFAYLIKPFSKRELHSAIEIGLYKAEMEKRLRESEKRFRETADLLPTGICEMDLNEMVSFINRAGLDMLGLSSQDFQAGIHFRRHIRKIETHTDCVQQALQGVHTSSGQFRMVRADGSVISVLAHCSPISSANRITGVRASLTDITELLKLQSRLRYARKMESIGTLAGGIAHEFNNALTAIITGIELLQMDLQSVAKAEKYLPSMQGAADRMAALVRQLLAYSGGGKFHVVTTSLDQFVNATLPFLYHSIAPGIDVSTDLEPDGPQVRIDETQFQMVLSALITNAGEAIDGQGRICIRTFHTIFDEERANQHAGLESGRYGCLSVEDTGRGMDESVRKRVFEPFFTTKFQGRGMGMASVYGIVRNHGGWIDVDSDPGRGTRVTVYIPETLQVELSHVDSEQG